MHAIITPSNEATAALPYTPRPTSADQTEAPSPSPSARASRHLPPSRPHQRPDRLELTNQSTTINIGRSCPRDEESGNTSTTPTKDLESDACSQFIGGIFLVSFLCMFVTMVCTAVFLNESSAALKDNSRYFDRMYSSKTTVTQTVTKTVGTVTQGYVERVTETITQLVGSLTTGGA